MEDSPAVRAYRADQLRPTRAASTAPPGAQCVLVVDDDELTRRVYAMILARSGWVVDTAADGEEGWSAICSAPYDVVVTDHNMPRLTGLELIERLRQAGRMLPVILASGAVEPDSIEESIRRTIAAILRKPFAAAELVSAVRGAATFERPCGRSRPGSIALCEEQGPSPELFDPGPRQTRCL